MVDRYPVFEKWTHILNWILTTVERYPKSVRFTISSRISNLAIDVMENIIEAIYTKKRLYILKTTNLYIEKLRVFFRISAERRYISLKQYEFISIEINEAGMMIGGWIKVEAGRKPISRNN